MSDALTRRYLESAVEARELALGWHRLADSYVDTPQYFHPAAYKARDEAMYAGTEWHRRQANFHAALAPHNRSILLAEYNNRIAAMEAGGEVPCEIPFLPAEAVAC